MAKQTISVRLEEETVEFLKRQGESPHVQARIDLEAFQQILEAEERALRGFFTVVEMGVLVDAITCIVDKNPSVYGLSERVYFLLERHLLEVQLEKEGRDLLRKVRGLSLAQTQVLFRGVQRWVKGEASRKRKGESVEDGMVRVFGAVRVVSSDQVLDQ